MYQKPYAICNNFFQTDGKNQVLVQTCYKFISRLFDGQRTRKSRLKIFPTNLTSSNHEIKLLKSPKNACFFSKTIRKTPLRPSISCDLVLVSRSARIASTTPLGVALSYFRECVCTTGGEEQWIRLGENLIFPRPETWMCRTSRSICFLTGEYTAPDPRWWTYTPVFFLRFWVQLQKKTPKNPSIFCSKKNSKKKFRRFAPARNPKKNYKLQKKIRRFAPFLFKK